MSDLKEVDGIIIYSHQSQCPHCGELIEHEESSIERDGRYNEQCDSCEKEYIVNF